MPLNRNQLFGSKLIMYSCMYSVCTHICMCEYSCTLCIYMYVCIWADLRSKEISPESKVKGNY